MMPCVNYGQDFMHILFLNGKKKNSVVMAHKFSLLEQFEKC